jgi:8-oxo-dGTP pyrophosphatase MutT (NUDIX family)
MHIKIYFDDKPLFLCDQIDREIEPYVHHDDAIFMDEVDPHAVKTMIHEMQQPEVHAGVFLHQNLAALENAFFKKFTRIQAAGGVVKNQRGELLMIFRRGSWDLPKGKLDKGESLGHCAVREVGEETGLKKIRPGDQILTTYHTYHEGTRFILKESHWFGMIADGSETLKPQTEEDIHDIKWIEPSQVEEYLNKAYPMIRDIVSAAKEKGFLK